MVPREDLDLAIPVVLNAHQLSLFQPFAAELFSNAHGPVRCLLGCFLGAIWIIDGPHSLSQMQSCQYTCLQQQGQKLPERIPCRSAKEHIGTAPPPQQEPRPSATFTSVPEC